MATSIHGYQWLGVADYISLISLNTGKPEYPNDFHIRLKQGSNSNQLLKLSTTWGISHLGYQSPTAKRALSIVAKGAVASVLSIVSSTWTLKNAFGLQQEYFISVWKPELDSEDSTARVTVASRDKNSGDPNVSSAYSGSSYFNPKTGDINPHYAYDPLALQGFPLWTEEASNAAGFSAALEHADTLIRSPQELEILLALIKGSPHS